MREFVIANPIPREKLLAVAKTLPAAPRILAELGHMLRDLNYGLSEVTDLLKCDAALTARVLRIANSVVYGNSEPFGSLEAALARVGFAEVYRVVGFAAIAQVSSQKLSSYGIAAAQLRENALLTALIMEELANVANCDPKTAYTAGLLRSTGKLVVDRLAAPMKEIGNYESHGGCVTEWETGIVGLTNCEIASTVLSEWRFPQDLVVAIRGHYAPESSSSSLAHLLNLGAGAAERGGHGLPGEFSFWEPSAEKYSAAGVDQTAVDEALRCALEKFGPVRAAVG